MSITAQTRRESYDYIIPTIDTRQNMIMEVLQQAPDGMTAREVANKLYSLGVTSIIERNFAAPRLTELRDQGKIETIGKIKCPETGRNVAVWAIKREALI
jgi:hypothetical protein